DLSIQKIEDFQPLSKAANDAKRQFCKECRKTKKRYDAKQLGYPMSFYKGNENHTGEANGCEGCFWYDPIEFRRHLSINKKNT
ncbi:MAG: restriction endonuclease, partial [Clostridia bacterium]